MGIRKFEWVALLLFVSGCFDSPIPKCSTDEECILRAKGPAY